MKSAKDILSMVQFFYYRIRSERLSVEALYQDTYGCDLKIDYDLENRISVEPDPYYTEGLLIDKIMRLDKKLEKAQETINYYVYLIDWLENLCIKNLSESELLVIRMSFFAKNPMNRIQIAQKLKYSEAWVAKQRISAYQKLDNALLLARQAHSLPEELDDEHF